MIFVTVGTMHLGFARLIRKMDEIAGSTQERVVIQRGLSEVSPVHCEHFDFRPRSEIESLINLSRLVVTHAGIGSVIDALNQRRPLIVVPRLRKFGEHNNDHQLDLARAVERRGWGRAVFDVDLLDKLCAEPGAAYGAYTPARDDLIAAVRGSIRELVPKSAECRENP